MTGICHFDFADVFFVERLESEHEACEVIFDTALCFDNLVIDFVECSRNRFIFFHISHEGLENYVLSKHGYETCGNAMPGNVKQRESVERVIFYIKIVHIAGNFVQRAVTDGNIPASKFFGRIRKEFFLYQ